MNTLHKEGYIHGDIKPDNILLNTDSNGNISDIVLCDFETVRLKASFNMKAYTIQNIGSPIYMLPFIPRDTTFIDKWSWLLSLFYIIKRKNLYEEILLKYSTYSTSQFAIKSNILLNVFEKYITDIIAEIRSLLDQELRLDEELKTFINKTVSMLEIEYGNFLKNQNEPSSHREPLRRQGGKKNIKYIHVTVSKKNKKSS